MKRMSCMTFYVDYYGTIKIILDLLLAAELKFEPNFGLLLEGIGSKNEDTSLKKFSSTAPEFFLRLGLIQI